uniref:Maturase K n=1 Tax=Romanomermis culicivorax TaxID=13658 RepID=A0A915IUR7_ROMCU
MSQDFWSIEYLLDFCENPYQDSHEILLSLLELEYVPRLRNSEVLFHMPANYLKTTTNQER